MSAMKRKWEDEQEKKYNQEVYTDLEKLGRITLEKNRFKKTRVSFVESEYKKLSLPEKREFLQKIKHDLSVKYL